MIDFYLVSLASKNRALKQTYNVDERHRLLADMKNLAEGLLSELQYAIDHRVSSNQYNEPHVVKILRYWDHFLANLDDVTIANKIWTELCSYVERHILKQNPV